MNQPILARLAVLFVIVALAACSADPTATASREPTKPPATAAPTASPTASPEPTDEPTPSEQPSPTSDANPGGGFAIAPHPGADSLFLTRADCENRDDGYRLEYPADWFTNDETAGVPPCSWFGEDAIEADDDDDDVPDDVAIAIEVVDGEPQSPDDAVSQDVVIVGGTQTATRTEWEDDDDTVFAYVVQLGPPGEGPSLVARTDTDMDGDYDLNKAVLDRIMATMEFIGTTQ